MRKVLSLLVLLLLFVGCAKPISEIKYDDNIGKTVAVKGIVENPIKIGRLSGYVLKDSNGDRIAVASDRLPKEGDKVIARGILMKEGLLGYYIQID